MPKGFTSIGKETRLVRLLLVINTEVSAAKDF
jgi:hypothetical protein